MWRLILKPALTEQNRTVLAGDPRGAFCRREGRCDAEYGDGSDGGGIWDRVGRYLIMACYPVFVL